MNEPGRPSSLAFLSTRKNLAALFNTDDPFPWNWVETGSNYTLKCPSNQWEDPPYRTKALYRWDMKINGTSRPSQRTACMSVRQGEVLSATGKPAYRHYDVHRYEEQAGFRAGATDCAFRSVSMVGVKRNRLGTFSRISLVDADWSCPGRLLSVRVSGLAIGWETTRQLGMK